MLMIPFVLLSCGNIVIKEDQLKRQELRFVNDQRKMLDSIAEAGTGTKIMFSSSKIFEGTIDNVLIFRYDYKGCDYCADSSLSVVEAWAKTASVDLRIISNLPPENIESWKKGHRLTMNVYFEPDKLSLPAEYLNSSYFLLINKNDSIVSKIFIPSSNDLFLVKDFLKAIE